MGAFRIGGYVISLVMMIWGFGFATNWYRSYADAMFDQGISNIPFLETHILDIAGGSDMVEGSISLGIGVIMMAALLRTRPTH